MEIIDKYKTFENRKEAAHLLTPLLQDLKSSQPLIFAIPRGAMPMAQIVAQFLKAPLDVVLVKKLQHPEKPELTIGAVSETGAIVLSAHADDVSAKEIQRVALKEITFLQKRRRDFTGVDTSHDPQGRTVIIIDDGIATGCTILAAIRSLKAQGARRIVVAAPVASHQAVQRLRSEGADVRVYYVPEYFGAVSYFYKDFDQISDAEIGSYFQIRNFEIEVLSPENDLSLHAILGRPISPIGIVIFAHGSGSGRLSPRNQFVADFLNHHNIATVLADLLTDEEAQNRANVFNVKLLAERVQILIEWVKSRSEFKNIPIGLFGTSTGAAAALIAAANMPEKIDAVVSRGGRPDMALEFLKDVTAAVLLIVGAKDHQVIELNEKAYKELRGDKELQIIPDASHLFEEPGTLEIVAEDARRWFVKYFSREIVMNPSIDLPLFP